eukprot:9504009-Pyramimonas_sp.AAC.3
MHYLHGASGGTLHAQHRGRGLQSYIEETGSAEQQPGKFSAPLLLLRVTTPPLRREEEYPAPEGGWARCKHHVEQLGPGAPRPCRRVATTEKCCVGRELIT